MSIPRRINADSNSLCHVASQQIPQGQNNSVRILRYTLTGHACDQRSCRKMYQTLDQSREGTIFAKRSSPIVDTVLLTPAKASYKRRQRVRKPCY